MLEKISPDLIRKKPFELSALAVGLVGTGGLLVALFTARATPTVPQSPWTVPIAARPLPLPSVVAIQPPAFAPATAAPAAPPKIVLPLASQPGVLDERRQIALGMIETGNNDRRIGGAGEVSRYQIMPAVWQHYSDSRAYRDPEVSLEVAREHWAALYTSFKQQAHREPSDFDMYVLWNTRQGYYPSRDFNPARLAPNVRNRAQRYVNLVEFGEFANN